MAFLRLLLSNSSLSISTAQIKIPTEIPGSSNPDETRSKKNIAKYAREKKNDLDAVGILPLSSIGSRRSILQTVEEYHAHSRKQDHLRA